MKRVFISYSRTNEAFARKLAIALSELGADVWIDIEDIPVGMKWSSAIQEGLDSADAMLLIVSPASMESDNVEDEWHYFMDADKPVIPILYEPAKIHFQLNRLQWIDFHNRPFDLALDELVAHLNGEGIPLTARQPQQRNVGEIDKIVTVNPPQQKQEQNNTQASSPPYMMISVALVVIFAIGAGVIALLLAMGERLPDEPNTGAISAFDNPPQGLFYQTRGVDVHVEPNGESEVFTLADSWINVRVIGDDGQTWYQLLDAGDGTEGWQIARFLDVDATNLLVVPLLVDTFETTPQLLHFYTEPTTDSERITVQIDEIIGIVGFTYDDQGTLWYYIDFFLPSQNDSYVAWVQANTILNFSEDDTSRPFARFPLLADALIADTPLFEIQNVDSPNPLVRPLARGQSVVISDLIDLYILDVVRSSGQIFAYVGWVEDEENWSFAWIGVDTLDLDDADRSYLERLLD